MSQYSFLHSFIQHAINKVTSSNNQPRINQRIHPPTSQFEVPKSSVMHNFSTKTWNSGAQTTAPDVGHTNLEPLETKTGWWFQPF